MHRWGRLIAYAGELEKAAALKLEHDLRQQNLKLTDEEKKKLLEQQKLLGSAKLSGTLQNQALDLRGQLMERAGRTKEFAEERALREAKQTKGAELTAEEKAKVLQLSALSYNMQNVRGMQLGDLSIKTNSLTSRGGFAGGVRLPDTDQYNRLIAASSKNTEASLKKIETIMQELKIGD